MKSISKLLLLSLSLFAVSSTFSMADSSDSDSDVGGDSQGADQFNVVEEDGTQDDAHSRTFYQKNYAKLRTYLSEMKYKLEEIKYKVADKLEEYPNASKAVIGTGIAAGLTGTAYVAYKKIPAVKARVDKAGTILRNKATIAKAWVNTKWSELDKDKQVKAEQLAQLTKGALAAAVCIYSSHVMKDQLDFCLNIRSDFNVIPVSFALAARAYTISKLLPYAQESFQLKSPALITKPVAKKETRLASFIKGSLAGTVALAAAWEAKNLLNPDSKITLFRTEYKDIFQEVGAARHSGHGDRTFNDYYRDRQDIIYANVGRRKFPVLPRFADVAEALNLSYAAYNCGLYSYEKLKNTFRD